ncbi:hypothetical protein JW905_12935, partial [bacterium]|nr:hypothetical protein [candidate division CSSED10-310 bacterium]
KGFRWTRERAALFLPTAEPGAMLSLELDREPQTGAAGDGAILVQDSEVTRFSLEEAGWRTVTAELPEVKEPLYRVEIVMDSTWRPSELFPANPDRRQLGVKVHEARVLREIRHETFGNVIQLLQVDIAAGGGNRIDASYHWRALQAVPDDYSIFVHFVHDSLLSSYQSVFNKLRRRAGLLRDRLFQHDHQPAGGKRPTSNWRMGEIIGEEYSLQVPEGLRTGRYAVFVGFWNPCKGSRLPVTAGEHYRHAAPVTTIMLTP